MRDVGKCRSWGWSANLVAMGTSPPRVSADLVVAADGSIPAEQVAALGVLPGSHVRVVTQAGPVADSNLHGILDSIAGRMTRWPDATWDEFERGSRLAESDSERV